MKWALPFLVLIAASPAYAGDEATCERCHRTLSDPRLSRPVDQLATSVHRIAAGCSSCHGGDPRDPTVRAHAPELSFNARPSPTDAVHICGGCHGDPRYVRRFRADLPIDQALLFRASRHGQALARGGSAPSCTGCHGAHEVLSAGDPRSPTHRDEVTATCASCHDDAERMRASGLRAKQGLHWGRGAHAAALARGITDAPICTTCHGAHGETRAEIASLGHACQSCHTREQARLATSPHARAFERLGLAACSSCHDAHDTRGGSELVGLGAASSCVRCHREDGPARAAAAVLAELSEQVRKRARDARALLEQQRGVLADAAMLAAELTRVEEDLGPAIHSARVAEVEEVKARVDQAAARVQTAVSASRGREHGERRGRLVLLSSSSLLFLLLTAKSIANARARGARGET
jgi:predicted CXXCH cytochrome family protein